MKHHNICISCVLPKSVPSIKFDERGCCALCQKTIEDKQVQQEAASPKEGLSDDINRIKERGKGRSYDCLVGVSGGKDSSYLLHLLVDKHKLRCLAAYHRTPFTPDVIDSNLRRLVKKLNVPLVEMNISKESHRKSARELLLLWLKKPNPIYANLACAPCKQHNHEVYKIAKANNIEYLIFGGNSFETFQLGAGQFRNEAANVTKPATVWRQTQRMFMVLKRGINILIRTPALLRYFPMGFKAAVLFLNNETPYLRLRYPGIKTMSYYFHAGYDEKAVDSYLSEVGWKLPAGCHSSWRADCAFNEIKNYMFKRTSGMTYMDAYLSNMVRAGVLSRDEALKRIEVEGTISQQRIKEVCEILEISSARFA